MNVAQALYPAAVRKSFTAKLITGFFHITTVMVLFSAYVYLDLRQSLAAGASTTALYETALSGMLGLVLMTLINLGLFAAVVGGNTHSVLHELVEKSRRLADGDLDVSLSTQREDEVGTLYERFNEMSSSIRESLAEAEDARERAQEEKERAESALEDAEQLKEQVRETNEQLLADSEKLSETMAAAADGDFTVRFSAESDNEAMEQIETSFNDMLVEVERTIAELEAFADRVHEASNGVQSEIYDVDSQVEEVQEAIQEITSGADRQSEQIQGVAAEIEDISAATEEVAATASEIADTAERSAAIGEDGREAATDAIETIEAVQDTAAETVARIEGLDERMDAIDEVTTLIADIADQTHMLALNASIEAARADGEGDGFAVVAEEVKQLAMETQESTEEIETLVSEIQSETGEAVADIHATSEQIDTAVDTVEETVTILDEIVDNIERTNSGIQEVDRSTDTQAESVQDVALAVDDVASIAEETAAQSDSVVSATETQAAAVGRVVDQIDELETQAETLLGRLETVTVEAQPTAGDQLEVHADD